MNELLQELDELLRRVMYYSFAGWVLALLMMLRLPTPDAISPALLRQPDQQQISQAEFHFNYLGQDMRIIPVMSYEIYGLIVSQHDPSKWYSFDLTRKDDSLNTRDICLIWGSNLTRDEYRKVSFSNDETNCHWSYGKNVTQFNEKEVANNHLVTANDEVRKQISRLRVGDQVAISGKLVYYAEGRLPGVVFQSSLSREDTGQRAAEIVLVESLKVISSHNRIWAWLKDICFWVCVTVVSIRVSAFLAPMKLFRFRVPKWLRRIINIYKA